MIKSFKDKRTEALYLSRNSRGFPPDIIERARRKLAALNAAYTLDDLRVPPGNRLEQLKGDRAGQHPFASMTNGVYASAGRMPKSTTSKSVIVIEIRHAVRTG